jgi:Zn-dependent protease with chaperone function
MTYVLHHAATMALALAAIPILRRSRWTYRSPRVGIVLWQAVVLTVATAATGLALAVGLLPYGRGILPGLAHLARDATGSAAAPQSFGAPQIAAVVAGVLLATLWCAGLAGAAWSVARARRHHRALLALVARQDERTGDALVLDHPGVAAYCLPGRHPSIVLSTGTLELLTDDQLRAVLAHERAHVAERHDLVVLPFVAWRWLLRRTKAADAVRLLVEMCADDSAARVCGRRHLADALSRFAAAGAVASPAGALGAVDPGVEARILRLRRAERTLPLAVRLALVGLSLVVVTTPLSLFALPWSG